MVMIRLLVVCCFFAAMPAAETVAVGLVFDEQMTKHDNGPGHPESAQRLAWIKEGMQTRELLSRMTILQAQPATDESILAVHTPLHLQRYGSKGGLLQVPESTRVAARLAAGSAMVACDAVMAGLVRRAFCAVRPPGHHAGPENAEGFCYFNNVAVAVRHLQKQHGLKRVLILDWDVHAGNGTYAIFKTDPTVFDVHVHQDPATIYPGTGFAHEDGEGAGKGFSANIPLPRGTTGEQVNIILDTKLRKICEQFKPQFILLSAGFDMHADDPLGSFQVTSDNFIAMTTTLIDLAETWCEGRLVSVLEGGYSQAAMQDAVPLHIQAMLEVQPVAK